MALRRSSRKRGAPADEPIEGLRRSSRRPRRAEAEATEELISAAARLDEERRTEKRRYMNARVCFRRAFRSDTLQRRRQWLLRQVLSQHRKVALREPHEFTESMHHALREAGDVQGLFYCLKYIGAVRGYFDANLADTLRALPRESLAAYVRAISSAPTGRQIWKRELWNIVASLRPSRLLDELRTALPRPPTFDVCVYGTYVDADALEWFRTHGRFRLPIDASLLHRCATADAAEWVLRRDWPKRLPVWELVTALRSLLQFDEPPLVELLLTHTRVPATWDKVVLASEAETLVRRLYAANREIVYACVESGHLQLLQWFDSVVPLIGYAHEINDKYILVKKALRGGHVAVAQFLCDCGFALSSEQADELAMSTFPAGTSSAVFRFIAGVCPSFSVPSLQFPPDSIPHFRSVAQLEWAIKDDTASLDVIRSRTTVLWFDDDLELTSRVAALGGRVRIGRTDWSLEQALYFAQHATKEAVENYDRTRLDIKRSAHEWTPAHDRYDARRFLTAGGWAPLWPSQRLWMHAAEAAFARVAQRVGGDVMKYIRGFV